MSAPVVREQQHERRKKKKSYTESILILKLCRYCYCCRRCERPPPPPPPRPATHTTPCSAWLIHDHRWSLGMWQSIERTGSLLTIIIYRIVAPDFSLSTCSWIILRCCCCRGSAAAADTHLRSSMDRRRLLVSEFHSHMTADEWWMMIRATLALSCCWGLFRLGNERGGSIGRWGDINSREKADGHHHLFTCGRARPSIQSLHVAKLLLKSGMFSTDGVFKFTWRPSVFYSVHIQTYGFSMLRNHQYTGRN